MFIHGYFQSSLWFCSLQIKILIVWTSFYNAKNIRALEKLTTKHDSFRILFCVLGNNNEEIPLDGKYHFWSYESFYFGCTCNLRAYVEMIKSTLSVNAISLLSYEVPFSRLLHNWNSWKIYKKCDTMNVKSIWLIMIMKYFLHYKSKLIIRPSISKWIWCKDISRVWIIVLWSIHGYNFVNW